MNNKNNYLKILNGYLGSSFVKTCNYSTGYNSYVFIINGEFVFKFPKDAEKYLYNPKNLAYH